jgi:hypothetical protein
VSVLKRYDPSESRFVIVGGGAAGTAGLPVGGAVGAFGQSGRWFTTHHQTVTVRSMNDGWEFAVPLYLSRARSLNAVGVEVTAAGGAGSTVRLGARADTGEGAPGTLLLDAGTVDTATTGVKDRAFFVDLPAGLSWLTATAQGSATVPTLRGVSGAVPPFALVSMSSALVGAASAAFMAGRTGALPAEYGDFVSSTAGSGPRIIVRGT